MKMHEIIVDNIGTVYNGSDDTEAENTFNEYMEQSQSKYSRASGESVTWLTDGEIRQEHRGEYETY